MSSQCPTEDLESLASICLATAKQIKAHLSATNQPPMSFALDGPAAFPSAPVEIQQARTSLLDAAKKLSALVTGPDDFFKWTILENLHDLNACRYIYHFGIARYVPLDTPISIPNLATAAKVSEVQLRQILRQAVTAHIFSEPAPGFIAHTAASRLFLSENGPRDVIGYITEEAMPMINSQIPALEKAGHGSMEANESAWAVAMGTKLPVFAFYKADPVRGPRFAKCMHYLTAGDAHSVKNVVSGFDWKGLGAVTVVDLAGSLGHCSVAIAQAAPEIKCLVQDLPNVIAVAKDPKTSIVPEAVKDRISFMAHDFFQPQLVKARCYFLRYALHVYSDKYAAKILQALSPALEVSARVIIMDQVMPDAGYTRQMTTMDLQMMAMFNARERTMAEWEEIIKAGDSRFRIKSVVTPPKSVLSMIELIVE